jgi:hypothetical protein
VTTQEALRPRDIYEAWAAAMDRQGRVLAPERRTWDLLPQQEKDLDADIAYQLNRAALAATPPAPGLDVGLRAERDNLYWYFLMREQGGPDGSDLDEAVTEDALATIEAITREYDALAPSPDTEETHD